jgi:hypothetical protein
MKGAELNKPEADCGAQGKSVSPLLVPEPTDNQIAFR